MTKEMEIASAIPPAKLFKVFLLDAHNTIPTILPQTFKSIEIIEGDGGSGSIKKTTFAEGLEKVFYKTQIVPSPDGGSISKCTTKYYPKGDSNINIDKIKEGEQKAMEIFKAVEAHVLANPDAYN
ncbi:hypothetical protein P3X46_005907 [Hevea brasiliensis]|uniref:Bet v I/Major latex protein domain-containing protein n=1 Tax=Hevea brasiliensis TaxID=3981 RepID=A0ABQ9MQE8_HEVBR|nr:hypothetical protein P3X46_005907 [Hevea brasiliensis]